MNKKKLFYFFAMLVGFALTPVVVGYSVALLKRVDYQLEQVKYAVMGAICAILFIPFSKALQWFYILFHEASHALAVMVFSGKIFSFNVGVESGYIKSNKDNLIIRLAPYLAPLLPYLVLFGYYLWLIYFRYTKGEISEIYFSYFLISFLYGVVTFYNFKLIVKETSDIETDKLALSFTVIINSYIFSSAVLVYLLFESLDMVNRYYLI